MNLESILLRTLRRSEVDMVMGSLTPEELWALGYIVTRPIEPPVVRPIHECDHSGYVRTGWVWSMFALWLAAMLMWYLK